MSTSPLTFTGRSLSLCGLTLGMLVALIGCGGAIANEPAHRPGPDLRGYYGTRTPGQLAYGGPTGVAPGYTRERPDLDGYLKPGVRGQQRPLIARAPVARTMPKARSARPEAVVATPAPASETQPLLASADPVPATPVAARTSPDEAQRYAAREAQSSKQQQYRGGDVVVISATTIIIILLVVLLILLLT